MVWAEGPPCALHFSCAAQHMHASQKSCELDICMKLQLRLRCSMRWCVQRWKRMKVGFSCHGYGAYPRHCTVFSLRILEMLAVAYHLCMEGLPAVALLNTSLNLSTVDAAWALNYCHSIFLEMHKWTAVDNSWTSKRVLCLPPCWSHHYDHELRLTSQALLELA